MLKHPAKNIIYSEMQGAENVWRYDLDRKQSKTIQPLAVQGDPKLRFNWNAPMAVSTHQADRFYMGSQFLHRSEDMGDTWTKISPDLTTNDKSKQNQEDSGGLSKDNSGAENHCTIFTIAESPLDGNVIWAGTDDGNVWITRNDGAAWENLTGRFPGVPAKTYVSRIEPSSHDSATVYVTFDNHRRGDFTPYVYVSNDFGKSFRSIVNNLPTGGIDFVHVIREDPINRDLLFVGTDVGIYVSGNRGASWQRFMTDLPAMPVHDLKIHPRDHELIAGTHGRSIWIVGIAPLQQITQTIAAADFHLFEPRTAYQFRQLPDDSPGSGDNRGQQMFRSITTQYGAEISYRVAPGTRPGPVRVVISDAQGELRTINGPSTPGLHTVRWNYQGRPAPRPPCRSSCGEAESAASRPHPA